MDLIFQTLTSLYTRSNSPVVVRSDFSHTSFLPGFQKMGVWGGGDLGWAALPSLSFSGCFKLGLTTALPSSGITLMENGTKHKEPQALESPFFHLCTCFTIILSLIVKKKTPLHIEMGTSSVYNLLCSQLLKKAGWVFTKMLVCWEIKGTVKWHFDYN